MLRVADTIVTDDFAAAGGGIRNARTLTVERTLLASNQANNGGAIGEMPSATMTISDTTMRDNDAVFAGLRHLERRRRCDHPG